MPDVVIGALGQLGTDLCRRIGVAVVALDWPEFDIRDADAVRRVLGAYAGATVFNCAAMTNVDACESDPREAFAVNAIGAMNIARAAREAGSALVFVSTDYVFGGDAARQTPYDESDPPAPLGVYGASKLSGEQLTLAYHPDAIVVRTCGLYGHAGARGKGGNFVETMIRLGQSGGPVRVVNDQSVSPTSTVACADRMLRLARAGARGLYHVAAADSCTWFEFTRGIFEIERLSATPTPITTAEFPRPATRPRLSALRSTRLADVGVPSCPPWRAMLSEYLASRPLRTSAEGQT